MKIITTSSYKNDYKRIIVRKHMNKEGERLEKIKNLILDSYNMKDLLMNPFSKIYKIEKKKGEIKEYYTAHLNEKIRLFMKPIGDYPYILEQIVEIELVKIDNHHYGDG